MFVHCCCCCCCCCCHIAVVAVVITFVVSIAFVVVVAVDYVKTDVIAVTGAHFVAAVVVGTLAVIRAVVVLVVGVITVIRIFAEYVAVVQMVAHGTNFSFPCRPGGVCDRWGSTAGHHRRLARLRAHTLSLHCWHLQLG